MSLLGDFGDVLGDSPSEGSIAYTRGAWLWGAASRGEAFSSAYQAMVGTPAGLRRDQALSMWQDIQTTLSEAGAAGAISFDQLASGALTGEEPANWTGQYTYRVNFTSRLRGCRRGVLPGIDAQMVHYLQRAYSRRGRERGFDHAGPARRDRHPRFHRP